MSDLTPAKLQELESALLQRRQELQAQVDPHSHRPDAPNAQVLTEQEVAEDNAAVADVLNDTDLAQLELDLAVIVEIDAALGRIKAGTYGRCTACEEDIPLARLTAMPSAHFCIGCQAKSEQRQGFPHNAAQ